MKAIGEAGAASAGQSVSPEAITLRYGFEPAILSRSLMGWWRSVMPPAPFYKRVIQWTMIWIGLLMVTLVLGALGIEPVLVGVAMIGMAVLVVIFVILQRVRMRQFAREIGSHWALAGETVAVIGASGAVFTDAVSRNELSWAAVDAVVGVRGATVLRSGVSMIAIPDRALPEGLSPRAFRARLEARGTA
jgi:hypothetical protein